MKRIVALLRARYDALSPMQKKILRFLVTGGANSLFAYAMYVLGSRGLGLSYLPAQVFAWGVGVAFSFLTFRAFVFTGGDRSLFAFARFLPTYILLLALSLVMMKVMVEGWGWHDLIAQALVIPTCAVFSFLFNRLFVFREKGE